MSRAVIDRMRVFLLEHRVFAAAVAASLAAYLGFAMVVITKFPPSGSLLVLVLLGSVVFTIGWLLTRKSRRLLESGELCHWDSPCQFHWSTASQAKSAAGEVILTNPRTIFASETKSFEFRPAKIIDIACYSDRAVIQTSSNKGTGTYLLHDAEAFVASLEAIAKKQKYLLAEGFTACRTRHIPDHVKQEVWARDGGSCIRCGARDYLEFDHIIPVAKGGANTIDNVQVLCRRCNGEKSDRI